MTLTIYHIDAFTDHLFAGNPACVCLLPEWLPEQTLKSIAIENNQPVTAFIVKHHDSYQIRWITPEYELDLCGHGTLAASHVILHILEPHLTKIGYDSKAGPLFAEKIDAWIQLNFPMKIITPITIPDALVQGLGIIPSEVFEYKDERIYALVADEKDVIHLNPDITQLKNLPHRGIIVTAKGKHVDFVSRTFYPQKQAPEDAVTGASHCALAPFWRDRLHKNILRAKQVSARGGFLECECKDDRVLLRAKAVLYMKGEMNL